MGIRVCIQYNTLHVEMGQWSVVAPPPDEMQFCWDATTLQWPIMSAILHGVSRNQLMARHKANHIQVVYAPSVEMAEMGLAVHHCGDVKVG